MRAHDPWATRTARRHTTAPPGLRRCDAQSSAAAFTHVCGSRSARACASHRLTISNGSLLTFRPESFVEEMVWAGVTSPAQVRRDLVGTRPHANTAPRTRKFIDRSVTTAGYSPHYC